MKGRMCGIFVKLLDLARCVSCGQGCVVASSCRGRGVFPSCNGRRMAQRAAHLVDHVIPPVTVRQWVISVPKRLRCFLADRPYFQSLEHLRRFCARPLFALERLSVIRDANGRISRVRYAMPRPTGRPSPGTLPAIAAPPMHRPAPTTPRAQAWAKLLARVGEEFPFECPACGGDIRLRGNGRKEPAHFDPKVCKRAKARIRKPA